jgi:hypothetical protein
LRSAWPAITVGSKSKKSFQQTRVARHAPSSAFAMIIIYFPHGAIAAG